MHVSGEKNVSNHVAQNIEDSRLLPHLSPRPGNISGAFFYIVRGAGALCVLTEIWFDLIWFDLHAISKVAVKTWYGFVNSINLPTKKWTGLCSSENLVWNFIDRGILLVSKQVYVTDRQRLWKDHRVDALSSWHCKSVSVCVCIGGVVSGIGPKGGPCRVRPLVSTTVAWLILSDAVSRMSVCH